jgi:hypothetical protein
MWKSLILPLVAAVFPLGSAQNMDEVNVSKGGTLSGPGLAVHDYDVVAFFTQGPPVLGSDAYTVAHGGGTYRFVSQAHLERSRPTPPNTSRLLAAFAPMARRSARSSTGIRAIGRSSTAGCI